jgi:periplasmic divalent cation tolerance protein
LLVLKTVSDRVEALIPRVRELHPYEVCEVLALDVSAGSEPYVAWLVASCGGPES